jgi:hypothetical protein
VKRFRISLRALALGVLIAALLLGGLSVARAQVGGASVTPPSTEQIAEMTQGLALEPAAVEPAVVTPGVQAAIIAAELLLVPEEFFVNLPLITR